MGQEKQLFLMFVFQLLDNMKIHNGMYFTKIRWKLPIVRIVGWSIRSQEERTLFIKLTN